MPRHGRGAVLFVWLERRGGAGPGALSPALRTTDSILQAEGGHAASEERSKAVGAIGRERVSEAASAAGGRRAMPAAVFITPWAAESPPHVPWRPGTPRQAQP